MPRYIFVTGGVMSGLGKGIVTASIAKLLKLSGISVTCVKIDPYLNMDAGTMNPLIHGEVFVTEDGGETDMDIGTYERFLDMNLTVEHNITTGQVYRRVIEEERTGRFLGKCVQIIPHVTDEIKARIMNLAKRIGVEVLVVECGGTVGDIEGLPFLEAFRQLRLELGPSNALFVHVTLAPSLDAGGEQKTKPTQHSVQELRRIGIQPDIVVVRAKRILSREAKEKISLLTSVDLRSVVSNPDVQSIYEVPENLEKEGILEAIAEKFRLGRREVFWDNWTGVVNSIKNSQEELKIAMVGKYIGLADSYVSVNEAVKHAGALESCRVKIDWVDAESFERNTESLSSLDSYHGVLIPGGFGSRGSEGKILAANYARLKGLPYLGICFGFQLAVVAFAKHVCGKEDANSTELNPRTGYPVVDLLPEQETVRQMGGTMRLGAHEIEILRDTRAYSLYGKERIWRRHRHRYEVNPSLRGELEKNGVRFSGYSDGRKRAEVLELPDHHYYVATQYHAEFSSRPGRPEPAYLGFIRAALERRVAVLAR